MSNNVNVDRSQRQVTIADRTFQLTEREQGSWNVAENGSPIGWFELKRVKGHSQWMVEHHDDQPGRTTSTNLIGRAWVDAHAGHGSPLPWP